MVMVLSNLVNTFMALSSKPNFTLYLKIITHIVSKVITIESKNYLNFSHDYLLRTSDISEKLWQLY